MNIKDIAKLAGVSPSTVSKIMNKKDESISQETREHVLKIVNEYNYVPYAGSRKLPKNTGLIGILMAHSGTFDSRLDGLLSEIQSFAYSPLLVNSYGDVEEELKNLTLLANKGVEGIIYQAVDRKNKENRKYLEELEIPFLLMEGPEFDSSFTHPLKKLADRMTKQLLELGHEKIACLIDEKMYSEAFIAGYQTALLEKKIPFDETLLLKEVDASLNDRIIQGQVTAIITMNENQGLEVERITTAKGLAIPADYSLLTVREETTDRADHLSSFLYPSFALGQELSRQLINKITSASPELWTEETLSINHFDTIAPLEKKAQKNILVIGSINMDSYLYSDTLPVAGVATFLRSSKQAVGGKAFNQALGASKLGQKVHLVGRLGKDSASNRVYEELQEAGISTKHLSRSTKSKTGQAYISVDQDGDSLLSILPGANADFTAGHLTTVEALFSDASFCLVQTEIPLKTVERVVELAAENDLPVILKPSGVKSIPDSILDKVDYLIPNEGELFHLAPESESLAEAANFVLAKGVKHVLVTLGDKGVFLKTKNRENYYPATDFTAVDTTGAGDAFISAFASYLAKDYTLEKAIQIANLAAGFSVSRDGVVRSLVSQELLENYLLKNEPDLLKNPLSD